MDVPRKDAGRKRLVRRSLIVLAVGAFLVLVPVGLARLKPAAPSVDRGSVHIDQVKRGPMVRNVRGLGTLVPEEILWIPASSDGRVEKILVRPGATVKPNTVIMVLTNPELQLAAFDAEWQVKAAEASLTDLKVKLQTQTLEQRSRTAQVQSEYVKARLAADRDEKLFKEGLTPDLTLRLSKATADELENRFKLEKERLDISKESVEAQLAGQRVTIDKLRAAHELQKAKVQALNIIAGTEGVLQQVAVEVGQRITAGTALAKVAQPWKLKAELKVPETQAKDVQLGQKAEIDTRNGIIMGRVSRIDPAVQAGTVTVDVKLEGELPLGARPDLSVDGTIELERMNDVLYVQRPVIGQQHSTISLFRLEPDGKEAIRVPVRLGRASVSNIEILDGLKIGDQVILSDMSAQDNFNRIRLQ